MKTIAYLGTKSVGYHCLKFLLEQEEALGAKVVLVLSNGNTLDPAHQSVPDLAREHQIPLGQTLKELLEFGEIDLLISVQYNEILKQVHLDCARQMAVNLHMAPLPEYRGCNQFSFAIIDGAETFGTTLHEMDTSVDGGDLLFEKRFAIPENCWVKTLYKMTEEASIELFESSIKKIIDGEVKRKPQQDVVEERGTSLHYRKEIKTIKQIDLNWDQEKIDRYIRATYFPPFEPPYVMVGGEKLYFNKNKELG